MGQRGEGECGDGRSRSSSSSGSSVDEPNGRRRRISNSSSSRNELESNLSSSSSRISASSSSSSSACELRAASRFPSSSLSYSPQELANMCWGLGRLKILPPKPWLEALLQAKALQNLQDFSP